MNEIEKLHVELQAARERTRRAVAAWQKGGWPEACEAAHHEELSLERQLAAKKGEEYAEPCGFPLEWDCGAPMPHLIVTDNKALLAFLLSEPDAGWDGRYVTVR